MSPKFKKTLKIITHLPPNNLLFIINIFHNFSITSYTSLGLNAVETLIKYFHRDTNVDK